MEHIISRISGGYAESGWIQPKCSCGWAGGKHYAHNDWQYTNCGDEGRDHVRTAKAASADTEPKK